MCDRFRHINISLPRLKPFVFLVEIKTHAFRNKIQLKPKKVIILILRGHYNNWFSNLTQWNIRYLEILFKAFFVQFVYRICFLLTTLEASAWFFYWSCCYLFWNATECVLIWNEEIFITSWYIGNYTVFFLICSLYAIQFINISEKKNPSIITKHYSQINLRATKFAIWLVDCSHVFPLKKSYLSICIIN